MKVTFGRGGYGKPTPAHISRRIDITTAVAAALTLWISSAAWIPSNVTTILTSILGGIGTVAQVIKPFFSLEGVPARVDSKEVTEMETKP